MDGWDYCGCYYFRQWWTIDDCFVVDWRWYFPDVVTTVVLRPTRNWNFVPDDGYCDDDDDDRNHHRDRNWDFVDDVVSVRICDLCDYYSDDGGTKENPVPPYPCRHDDDDHRPDGCHDDDDDDDDDRRHQNYGETIVDLLDYYPRLDFCADDDDCCCIDRNLHCDYYWRTVFDSDVGVVDRANNFCDEEGSENTDRRRPPRHDLDSILVPVDDDNAHYYCLLAPLGTSHAADCCDCSCDTVDLDIVVPIPIEIVGDCSENCLLDERTRHAVVVVVVVEVGAVVDQYCCEHSGLGSNWPRGHQEVLEREEVDHHHDGEEVVVVHWEGEVLHFAAIVDGDPYPVVVDLEDSLDHGYHCTLARGEGVGVVHHGHHEMAEEDHHGAPWDDEDDGVVVEEDLLLDLEGADDGEEDLDRGDEDNSHHRIDLLDACLDLLQDCVIVSDESRQYHERKQVEPPC